MRVTIANGKYTVVCDEVKGLRALRYGEEWRDLTGDNLVAELAFEIEELRTAIEPYAKRIADLESQLEAIGAGGVSGKLFKG